MASFRPSRKLYSSPSIKKKNNRILTCGYVMGANLFSFSFSMVSLSSLKSNLVPTKIIGTFGQWCRTSGYHLALTFSNDAGLTSEKQMRKTSWKQKNSLRILKQISCSENSIQGIKFDAFLKISLKNILKKC